MRLAGGTLTGHWRPFSAVCSNGPLKCGRSDVQIYAPASGDSVVMSWQRPASRLPWHPG
jgi:hypothetical protein